MAAAIVDLDINEGETWIMGIVLWENEDKTIPIDLSSWTFKGAFSFSTSCIPMAFTVIGNEIECRIEATALTAIPDKGSYSIEATDPTNVFRLQQGRLRVDGNSVCT